MSVISGAMNDFSCLSTAGEASLNLVELFVLTQAGLLAKFPD